MRAECENQQKNSPLQNAMVSYSESLVYAFDYYHSTRMECLFLWLSGDISFFRITRDLVSLSCLHIYVLYNDTFIYYLLHLYLYIYVYMWKTKTNTSSLNIYLYVPTCKGGGHPCLEHGCGEWHSCWAEHRADYEIHLVRFRCTAGARVHNICFFWCDDRQGPLAWNIGLLFCMKYSSSSVSCVKYRYCQAGPTAVFGSSASVASSSTVVAECTSRCLVLWMSTVF